MNNHTTNMGFSQENLCFISHLFSGFLSPKKAGSLVVFIVAFIVVFIVAFRVTFYPFPHHFSTRFASSFHPLLSGFDERREQQA